MLVILAQKRCRGCHNIHTHTQKAGAACASLETWAIGVHGFSIGVQSALENPNIILPAGKELQTWKDISDGLSPSGQNNL